MDKDMYDFMSAPGFGPSSPVVDRGVALHKMIRLLTMTLGGESYLNFMGNEFGHPEWIDFPRDDSYDPSTGAFVPGNGGSLEKCRRRWDLADADFLKYKFLYAFDRAMTHLDKAFGFLSAPHTWVSRKDEGDKVVVVERGDLVFVFNFHPTNSYTDYKVRGRFVAFVCVCCLCRCCLRCCSCCVHLSIPTPPPNQYPPPNLPTPPTHKRRSAAACRARTG